MNSYELGYHVLTGRGYVCLRTLTNQVKFEVIRETTSFGFHCGKSKSSVSDVMKFLPFLLKF